MRTLFTAVVLFIFINALALGGLFAWLATSGRLDKHRADQVVEMFKSTIAQQEQVKAEAQAAAEESRKVAEQAVRMEQVANGPLSPEMRLQRMAELNQHQRQLVERRQVEIDAIQRQLDLTRTQVDQRIEQFEKERDAFELAVEQRVTEFEDQDFKQAVALLEGLPPKQAKDMILEYLDQGIEPQVVSYLAAMDNRLATKVLKEFKDPREVEQAARLIEQVRLRSQNLLAEAGVQ